MRERSDMSKRLLSPDYEARGTLLTIWLVFMLMHAGLLMYDNITQFEADVSHLAPETPWFLFGLGIAACCEIVGLFILFTKRMWGFSIVALSELSSIIFTFFSGSPPSIFNIMFFLGKLVVLDFLLFIKSTTVFSYKKSTMSISRFVGIIVGICLIIAAIVAGNTVSPNNTPVTIPRWHYTPTPLQYTPIIITPIAITPLPHSIHIP